jgi:hypothetical protein
MAMDVRVAGEASDVHGLTGHDRAGFPVVVYKRSE